ncbi:MAG: SGNH/GDSL hydrolase family protein [Verrucomicrobia bacterium]|nr:SGNH/GDSL hydrolase family protein [Verrucomicrobiota bacterium]
MIDRGPSCERAHLRYSPEPNLGKFIQRKDQRSYCVRSWRKQIYATRRICFLVASTVLTLAAALGTRAGNAQNGDNGDWIETWTASPQPIWTADFFAPLNIPRSLRYQTVRQIATITLGGTRVRIVLSNEYGSEPLVIGAAHVAVAGQGGAIVAGSDRPVTFGGQPSVTIPPGAPVISDPVELKVEPLSEVAVSLFFPEITPLTTFHWEGVQTAYISPEGNFAGDTEMKTDSTIKSRLFLSGILVDAPAHARAIVTFGDSITDGANSTPDANHRWPDFLARRLAQAGGAPTAVLNEGISGARVLTDRMGVNALARFDRDVLSRPHADTVILMMGINDIGWPGCILAPRETEPSANDIIEGYKQLIARAHLHGMRIIGATLTPFEDTFKGNPIEGYYNADKEKIREAVNDWIRTGGAFDGVIDFDASTRDPNRPTHILAKYDSGDHLHPQDDGYKAMADSIDLKLLTAQP